MEKEDAAARKCNKGIKAQVMATVTDSAGTPGLWMQAARGPEGIATLI
jgi:hypothetical protein